MPHPECFDFMTLRRSRAGVRSPIRGRASPIPPMVLALTIACGGGSSTPRAPAIDTEGVCLGARRDLKEAAELAEQGFLGRALALAERADRACSTARSRLQLAQVFAGVGLDHLAREAYRRYGMSEGGDADRATKAAAALAGRPAMRRRAPPGDRARARTLYLEAQARGVNPESALRALEQSYALWPHPLTLVQQGIAHRRAGRENQARTTYARALAMAEVTRHERARPVRIRQTVDIVAAAFHPAGRRLATATKKGGVELWDFERLEVARVFGHSGATRLVFSPSGRQLATASTVKKGSLVRLWDTSTGTMAHQISLPAVVNDVVFAADGKLLVVAGADGTVRLYRTDTGKLDFDWSFERGADVVALSPTSSRLAVAGDRFVQVISVAKPSAPRVFAVHGAPITALAFDATGAMIASGARDGSVRLNDGSGGAEVTSHSAHGAPVVAVGVRKSSQHLVSLAADGTSHLWSLSRPGDTYTVTLRGAGRVFSIDPELRTAITVNERGIVQWDVDKGRAVRLMEGRASPLRAVAVDSGGRFIVAGNDDGTIRRWDLESGTFTLLEGHKGPVHALAFSADGRWLASGGEDSTVRVWEMKTGREFQAFDERRGAAIAVGFSPDARVVVGRFRGASKTPGGRPGATLAWDIHRSRGEPVPAEVSLPAPGLALRARGGSVEVVGARDGSLAVLRAGRHVAELYAARDGGWLVTAVDGRVDGSKGAQSFLYWQAGDVDLPGFVGWQRQYTPRLLGSLFSDR